MYFQSQLKKRNWPFHGRQSDGHLQWKKASQNLQNFIEAEQLTLMKSFQYPRQKSTSSKKDKINKMKSLELIRFSHRQTERSPRQLSKQSKESTKSILLQPKYIKNPQILSLSPKNQTRSIFGKNNPQIGIQTFDEEPQTKKRDLSEQNKCLKQLIQILQTEILNFSRTITEKQSKITELKNDLRDYTDKLHQQILITNETKEKLEKQIQLNKCMEYIISELNDKVSTLLSKNVLLQETIDEYKLKEQQNLADTFSESHSCLSINSQSQKKYPCSELIKNNQIHMFEMESQILIEDKQNWSFSGLDISSFSKTPNKIHEVSPFSTWEQGSPSSTSQFMPDQQIDEIIGRHKVEISNLKEQLKYYEIENQMLRRKKEMTEKNTIEIEELKFRIQKLSEQNKMMQCENKKKPKVSPDFRPLKNPSKVLATYKQCDTTKTVIKTQKKFEGKVHPSNQLKLNLDSDNMETQKKERVEQVDSPTKRKSPLQRKFVRRPSKSPRSSSSLEDDSEISLEFSPQRI